MPTLETPGGKPVDVTPVDPDAVNAAFRSAMDDDGPDEQAPPKRAPRQPDGGGAKPRTSKSEKSRTTAKPAVALDDAQRAAGVQGLAQIGAGFALMLGRATGRDAYQADAVTVASAAPQIADACVQVAKTDAKFAAALDKVCSSGPYAALISVGVSVGMQVMRNHKPALALPGTVHPDELLRSNDGQAVPAAA